MLPLGNWERSVNGVCLINGTREGGGFRNGEESSYMEQLMRVWISHLIERHKHSSHVTVSGRWSDGVQKIWSDGVQERWSDGVQGRWIS